MSSSPVSMLSTTVGMQPGIILASGIVVPLHMLPLVLDDRLRSALRGIVYKLIGGTIVDPGDKENFQDMLEDIRKFNDEQDIGMSRLKDHSQSNVNEHIDHLLGIINPIIDSFTQGLYTNLSAVEMSEDMRQSITKLQKSEEHFAFLQKTCLMLHKDTSILRKSVTSLEKKLEARGKTIDRLRESLYKELVALRARLTKRIEYATEFAHSSADLHQDIISLLNWQTEFEKTILDHEVTENTKKDMVSSEVLRKVVEKYEFRLTRVQMELESATTNKDQDNQTLSEKLELTRKQLAYAEEKLAQTLSSLSEEDLKHRINMQDDEIRSLRAQLAKAIEEKDEVEDVMRDIKTSMMDLDYVKNSSQMEKFDIQYLFQREMMAIEEEKLKLEEERKRMRDEQDSMLRRGLSSSNLHVHDLSIIQTLDVSQRSHSRMSQSSDDDLGSSYSPAAASAGKKGMRSSSHKKHLSVDTESSIVSETTSPHSSATRTDLGGGDSVRPRTAHKKPAGRARSATVSTPSPSRESPTTLEKLAKKVKNARRMSPVPSEKEQQKKAEIVNIPAVSSSGSSPLSRKSSTSLLQASKDVSRRNSGQNLRSPEAESRSTIVVKVPISVAHKLSQTDPTSLVDSKSVKLQTESVELPDGLLPPMPPLFSTSVGSQTAWNSLNFKLAMWRQFSRGPVPEKIARAVAEGSKEAQMVAFEETILSSRSSLGMDFTGEAGFPAEIMDSYLDWVEEEVEQSGALMLTHRESSLSLESHCSASSIRPSSAKNPHGPASRPSSGKGTNISKEALIDDLRSQGYDVDMLVSLSSEELYLIQQHRGFELLERLAHADETSPYYRAVRSSLERMLQFQKQNLGHTINISTENMYPGMMTPIALDEFRPGLIIPAGSQSTRRSKDNTPRDGPFSVDDATFPYQATGSNKREAVIGSWADEDDAEFRRSARQSFEAYSTPNSTRPSTASGRGDSFRSSPSVGNKDRPQSASRNSLGAASSPPTVRDRPSSASSHLSVISALAQNRMQQEDYLRNELAQLQQSQLQATAAPQHVNGKFTPLTRIEEVMTREREARRSSALSGIQRVQEEKLQRSFAKILQNRDSPSPRQSKPLPSPGRRSSAGIAVEIVRKAAADVSGSSFESPPKAMSMSSMSPIQMQSPMLTIDYVPNVVMTTDTFLTQPPSRPITPVNRPVVAIKHAGK
eukprot:ANDGO_03180.mRNA.1 hypothetical protein